MQGTNYIFSKAATKCCSGIIIHLLKNKSFCCNILYKPEAQQSLQTTVILTILIKNDSCSFEADCHGKALAEKPVLFCHDRNLSQLYVHWHLPSVKANRINLFHFSLRLVLLFIVCEVD